MSIKQAQNGSGKRLPPSGNVKKQALDMIVIFSASHHHHRVNLRKSCRCRKNKNTSENEYKKKKEKKKKQNLEQMDKTNGYKRHSSYIKLEVFDSSSANKSS